MKYKIARHRLLSPEAEDEIIANIGDGYSPIDIAHAIGMSVSGIYRMMSRRGVKPPTARGRKKKSETRVRAMFNDYYLAHCASHPPEWLKILTTNVK